MKPCGGPILSGNLPKCLLLKIAVLHIGRPTDVTQELCETNTIYGVCAFTVSDIYINFFIVMTIYNNNGPVNINHNSRVHCSDLFCC